MAGNQRVCAHCWKPMNALDSGKRICSNDNHVYHTLCFEESKRQATVNPLRRDLHPQVAGPLLGMDLPPSLPVDGEFCPSCHPHVTRFHFYCLGCSGRIFSRQSFISPCHEHPFHRRCLKRGHPKDTPDEHLPCPICKPGEALPFFI